eukprot:scaffold36274_cov125-Isochrysis_galbana.AAC.4
MEQLPADARAAPSASGPNDVDMGIASSPKRPRDPTQDNKRCWRTSLGRQNVCPESLPEPASQSLAHHTSHHPYGSVS